MNSHDMDLLNIYVMALPFMVFGLGLFVYWLTGWMDRREARRHHHAAE